MFPLAHAAQFSADYWIKRLPKAHLPYLSAAAIRQHNALMLANEPSLLDLSGMPAVLPKASVLARLTTSCQCADSLLYAQNGRELAQSTWQALIHNSAMDDLPEIIKPRYGLAVTRADLRRFPSNFPVYSDVEQRDIDRFQESALFPGDAVVVLHQSRDQAWWYIGSQHYYGWVDGQAVAMGSREQVLGYAQGARARMITGSVVHTAYTQQLPAVSRLPLDMGVRIPLCRDWPLDKPVNGQLAAASWILTLPQRNPDGSLHFAPALLPRSADSHADYLPLTPANIIGQAFKFLGERYGWGHSFNARDCSGLVGEIYRSFNIVLPRNSGDQAHSWVLDTVKFPAPDAHSARLIALQHLHVGDLVYIPGHVMLVIGHDQGQTWVIHDTASSGYLNGSGNFVRVLVNGVVITPLEQLYLDANTSYVERIIGIKRVNRHIE